MPSRCNLVIDGNVCCVSEHPSRRLPAIARIWTIVGYGDKHGDRPMHWERIAMMEEQDYRIVNDEPFDGGSYSVWAYPQAQCVLAETQNTDGLTTEYPRRCMQ